MNFASLVLILASLLTFLDDVWASKEVEFCDDYSVCLQKLEGKQRECLKLPVPDSEREQDLSSAGRRRRKEVHRELASLHLRKTELLRDCVADNIDRAEDILDPVKVAA
ncbi:hypothetical protein AAVH_04905 [Aphelenchoides avenae]|nr:hypothetical protein AAVH_04905 [Aphelenchus avenae]